MTQKQQIKKLLHLISDLHEDCMMALDRRWDKSDEGFRDSITNIEMVLDDTGLKLPRRRK